MNRTLKTVLFAVAMLAIAFSVKAASVTFSSGVANQYISFGSGAVLYDENPVLQSDLFVSFENGFYADLWNSKSFVSSWGENLGDELDYGFGWAGSIGGGFTLDIGVTYFDEPTIADFAEGDILYTHVKLSHEIETFSEFGLGTLTVSGMFDSYKTLFGTDYDGGNLYGIGANINQVWGKTTSFNLNQVLAYDDGGFGLDDGFIIEWSAGLTHRLSDRTSLVLPSITLYTPLSVHDARETELVLYGGIKVGL